MRYWIPINTLMCLLLGASAAWIWFKWSRQQRLTSSWRAAVFTFGICLATFTTGLSIFLLMHAALTGGYPFYHPVELFCIRYGALTALLGTAASVTGTGRLRLQVAALSIVNLLLWLMDAVAQ
ncbi:MAG TPA: hypothetical protein VKF79_01490 [Candidatus Acidoferrum sp.]|nr:hypothetical protein [Candidatus Acidoferrum sp.]